MRLFLNLIAPQGASTASYAVITVVSLIAGCIVPGSGRSPTAAGLKPAELVDPTAHGADGPPPPIFGQLFAVGERVREAQRPTVLPPRRAVLVLSGGGAFGAFPAGLLCGWTESGNRPKFDVVTGVSTGALVAVYAFLGSEYDSELRRVYTTASTADIYKKKPLVRSILSDSLNDNGPLSRQIDSAITPEITRILAEEHRRGRRLYIGTTDLDGRRAVVWDLGGIAASGKSDARELICKLLLASAAIPGFFPAVEIPVEIDGRHFVERHVDGGVTQPLFFRPPHVSAEDRKKLPPELYYGSDEYVIVSGKLYADPEAVKPQVLKVVGSSVSTFLYAQTRDALVKLYMQSMLTGMNYHLAALPLDFPAPTSATDFIPSEMKKMFEEGRRQAQSGTAWRKTPPGVAGGEELLQRAGTTLTVVPRAARSTTNQESQSKGPAD